MDLPPRHMLWQNQNTSWRVLNCRVITAIRSPSIGNVDTGHLTHTCSPLTCHELQDASLSCKAPQIHAKSDGWLSHAKAIFTAKASSRELNCRAITAILSPTMCKEDTELSHIPRPPSTCRQLQDASSSCKAPQIHAKSDGWLGHAKAIFTAKASSRELNCRAITAILSPTMCKEDTELSHIPRPPSTCRQLQDASLSCKAPQIHAKSDGWLSHAKAIFTAKASSRELNCRAITAILSPTMCKEDTELSHIPRPPSTCRQLQDASSSCKAPQIHAKSDGWLGHAKAIFTAKASSRELNCRAITAILSPKMCKEDTELSHIPCPPSTCRQLQDASLSCKAPQIHAKSDGWLSHAKAIFTAKASSRELNCRAITAILSPTMCKEDTELSHIPPSTCRQLQDASSSCKAPQIHAKTDGWLGHAKAIFTAKASSRELN